MNELREPLEREARRVSARSDALASVLGRAKRARSIRRIGSAAIALMIGGGGLAVALGAFQPGGSVRPVTEPKPSPTSRAATFSYDVPSESMLPSFATGQTVEVDPNAGIPKRGAVIVFQDPNAAFFDVDGEQCGPDNNCFMKRVIALPGEAIEIKEGRVFVDGAALAEPYARLGSDTFGPVTVPTGHYFVMGDNRPNSSDSRSVLGMIPDEAILGVVVQDG